MISKFCIKNCNKISHIRIWFGPTFDSWQIQFLFFCRFTTIGWCFFFRTIRHTWGLTLWVKVFLYLVNRNTIDDRCYYFVQGVAGRGRRKSLRLGNATKDHFGRKTKIKHSKVFEKLHQDIGVLVKADRDTWLAAKGHASQN